MKHTISKFLTMGSSGIDTLVNSFKNFKQNSFTNEIEREFKRQIVAFKRMNAKMGLGHIINPNLTPFIREFEVAKYDVTKLSAKKRMSLDSMYKEMSQNTDPEMSNYAKIYCKAYDCLVSGKLAQIYKKLNDSNIIKDMGMESMNIDELEKMLSKRNLLTVISKESLDMNALYKFLDKNDQSSESVLVAISSVVMFISVIVSNIISYILPFIIIILVTTLLVKLCYIFEDEQSEESSFNKKKKLSKFFDTIVLKCADVGIDFINMLSEKGFDKLDKIIMEVNKVKSKEDLHEQSEEGAVNVVAGGVGSAVLFTSGHPLFAIALLVFILLPLVRGTAYFFKHLNYNLKSFWTEQSEWVGVNIRILKEKMDNPATPKSEKERIKKIITKQEAWKKRLGKWGGDLYKSHTEAEIKAQREVKEEEIINYDKIVDEQDANRESNELEKEKMDNPTEQNPKSTSNKPTIMF